MLSDATPGHFLAILELNEAAVAALSPLDVEPLAQLHAQAALHRVIVQNGRIEALLLACREIADDDGANYRWFTQRCARFLKVDRIMVAGGGQAQGAGSRLYRDDRAQASADAVPFITGEFDLELLNPVSENVRAKKNLRDAGLRHLAGGKTASRQALETKLG